jgi:hypothetical protein
MNATTIEKRVAAREQARVAAGLVIEEVGRVPTEAQSSFWDEIKKMLPIPQSAPTSQAKGEPFTDRQASAFGKTRMPWGKYSGQCVDEVPLDYLERICDPQPFIRSLKRYVTSTRILAESKDPNCDD